MKLTVEQVRRALTAGVHYGAVGDEAARVLSKGHIVLLPDGTAEIVVPTTADQMPADKAFTRALRARVEGGDSSITTWRKIQGKPRDE